MLYLDQPQVIARTRMHCQHEDGVWNNLPHLTQSGGAGGPCDIGEPCANCRKKDLFRQVRKGYSCYARWLILCDQAGYLSGVSRSWRYASVWR